MDNDFENAPRAKKSLGQNFLQDANIARKIVGCLHIEPSDRVIEIGPGPGMLSRIINAARPAYFCMVEKDDALANQRRDEAQGWSAAEGGAAVTEVFCSDAMTMPWRDMREPVKIIGNLPYNIASPLMWDILSQTPGLVRAVFMVQKEVGQRLVAAPNSKTYGALSVWVQSHCRPKLEFIVPPQVFRPRPKIDSAVLSFEPLPPACRPARPDVLSTILKVLFQQRRKQLGHSLKLLEGGLEAAGALGINLTHRPENISPERYKELAERLATL